MLSAVEGLEVAAPALEPFVVPIAVVVLLGLFAIQRRGTASVGRLFGPVMLRLVRRRSRVLGIGSDRPQPGRAGGAQPALRHRLLRASPARGFLALGAVVLAVTGAEALYADMGHFGARPIRLAWLGFVLPALVLNYFGQGALLLATRGARRTRSTMLAPDWAARPAGRARHAGHDHRLAGGDLGRFSLTRQAMQLGYLPRMKIQHTSAAAIGPDLHPAGQLAADGRRPRCWSSASARRAISPPPTASPSPAPC